MKHLLINLSVVFTVAFFFCACNKQNPPPAQTSSNTKNQTNNTGYYPDSLTGTKWQLYQYRNNATTNPMQRNDTLVFINSNTYEWNHVTQTYSLYTADNIYYKYSFILNNTPFGSLRGLPPLTFKTYGEIIDEPFSQIGTSNGQTFNLWLKKIN